MAININIKEVDSPNDGGICGAFYCALSLDNENIIAFSCAPLSLL